MNILVQNEIGGVVVGSVLLVEDVRFTRAMTRRMIATAIRGDVFEAENGQKALETLRPENEIEVVVADISMPGISGLELLKDIRCGKSTVARDLPVIIISGAVTAAVREALEKLDVTAIIAKPVRKDELLGHLERLGEQTLRAGQAKPIADYRAVKVSGLLEAVADTPPDLGHFESFDDRVRFLETVPALEGLDLDAIRQLAGRAEVLQFSKDAEIEPSEFAADRLMLIGRGEAEVLRTTRSSRSGATEHRVDLLEAGNLLGITAFMALPGEAEHSQIRITRPTEVLALEFDADDAEHSQLRDKVKLSVAGTLAQRLTQSDEAQAEALAQRLAETRIKRTAGGFVIMTASALAIYTLTMRALLDLDLSGADRGVASVVMILVAFLPFILSVYTGPFKFADLGLTFKGAGAAVREAVLFSAIFLVGLAGLKYLIVTQVPAFLEHDVFELARTFSRPGPDGGIDVQFYAINIVVYALFVPIQEVVVRCGLQSLIREFLYGSDRYRTIVAILVSNIFFAAAHTHLNVGIALATFVGGLFFGWLFHRHRSIVGVSISHIMIGGAALFALGLETFF